MKQQQRCFFSLTLAFIIFLLPVRGWAQVESVQGFVTDASNGEPIPGAYVIVQGTDKGAITDQDGHYVLSLKGDEDPVLVFSFIGYKGETVNIYTMISFSVTSITLMYTNADIFSNYCICIHFVSHSLQTFSKFYLPHSFGINRCINYAV